MKTENTKDPLVHVRNISQQFELLVQHLREDIDLLDDSQCKAMFETSAEVLLGLNKAFHDFENKNESAWK